MDSELYRIASKACIDSYENNVDLGTTEYAVTEVEYKFYKLEVLAIPGTNELLDWKENLNLLSTGGIKRSAVKAAQEIHEKFKRNTKLPLLVTGHSKAGATAIAYKRLFGADYCVSFCPARSLRYNIDRLMEDTTIFIDKDDPVPRLGFLSFGHPICTRIYLPDDFPGFNVSDHFMKHIDEYVKELED